MTDFLVQLHDPNRPAGQNDMHFAQVDTATAADAQALALQMFGPSGYTEVVSTTEVADQPERTSLVVGPTITPPTTTLDQQLADALAALPADQAVTGAQLSNLISILRGA